MLPDQSHVSIGGVSYRLDEGYLRETGRRCYEHRGTSLFVGRTDITGRPGATNLQPDDMKWDITSFFGEGQVVLDITDDTSAGRFYRSEGLDFRTAGTAKLNQSVVNTTPAQGSTSSDTFQGVDMTETSTSGATTVVNTDDRRLDELTPAPAQIESSDFNVGGTAQQVQVGFFVYRDSVDAATTTIEGSDLKLHQGDGKVRDTDFMLSSPTSSCRTGRIASLDANTTYTVQAPTFVSGGSGTLPVTVVLSVWNVTDSADPKLVSEKSFAFYGTSTPVPRLSFTSRADQAYQFRVRWAPGAATTATRVIVDSMSYYPNLDRNVATIEVYNQTAGTSVTSRNVEITSTESDQQTAAITFTAAALTDYRFRVTRYAGAQRIIVDKVVASKQGATAFTHDAMELGHNGNVYLAATSGTTLQWFTYDFANEDWDVGQTSTIGSGDKVLALAHTDSYEYALVSDSKIYRTNGSSGAGNTECMFSSGSITGEPVGMAICQDRIFVLCEDTTNGVYVNTYAVDAAFAAESASAMRLSREQVTSAKSTAETDLRQRMCASPTGARFFVNYGVSSVIYEADSSGASLVVDEIARLDPGVKATAIAFSGGITYITGYFLAESGINPRSALWIIDNNGVLQRVGYMRRDDPPTDYPIDIAPYQNDVWILQGDYVWRYSLTTGGLFLEYQLQPTTSSSQRAIAVTQGHTFAGYTSEIIVGGSVADYRQSSVEGGNTYVSSIYDYGLPGFRKIFTKAQIITDDMPEDVGVTIEYQIDQDGEWHLLGSANSGSDNEFYASSASEVVLFTSIQVRVTLSSGTGQNTPTLKGVVLTASPAENSEEFTMVLRCEEEDSSDHIDGKQATGAEKAENVIELWRSGYPTTLSDGYSVKDVGWTDYLVRITNLSDQRNKEGEGRVVVTMKVL